MAASPGGAAVPGAAESMPFIVWTAGCPPGPVDYQTRAIMDLRGRETRRGWWVRLDGGGPTRDEPGAHHGGLGRGGGEGGGLRGWSSGSCRTTALSVASHPGRSRFRDERRPESVKCTDQAPTPTTSGNGEARIRRVRERFRVVARATADAIWDWDLRTGRDLVERGLERIFACR